MVRKPILLTLLLSAAIVYADTGFKSTIGITETDGTPSCQAGQVKFSPGTVTCAGNVATVTNTGGGGGSGSVGGTINHAPQFSVGYYSHAGDTDTISGFPQTQIVVSTNTGVFVSTLTVTSTATVLGPLVITPTVDNQTSATTPLIVNTKNGSFQSFGPSVFLNHTANGGVVSSSTYVSFGAGGVQNSHLGWSSFYNGGDGKGGLFVRNGLADIPGLVVSAGTFSTGYNDRFIGIGGQATHATLEVSPSNTYPAMAINAPASGTSELLEFWDNAHSVIYSSVTPTEMYHQNFRAGFGVKTSTLQVTSIASGTQCLQADGSGNITGTGSACGSGGGGSTGGTINAANQFSLPYYSLGGSSNILSGFSGATISTNTGVTISTFTASSATLTALSVNGSGNGAITLTISGSTFSVTSSSITPTVGHVASWSGTGTLVDGGTGGGSGTPGGSPGQIQYNSAGSFGGVAGSVATASSVTLPTTAIVSSGTFTIVGPTPVNYLSLSLTDTDSTFRFFQSGVNDNLLTLGNTNGLSVNNKFKTTGANNVINTAGALISASANGGNLSAPGIVDLWSASGQPNYVSFNETGVANNGTMGFPAGGGPFIFYTGSETFGSGTERLRISPTGGLIASSSATILGSGGLGVTYGAILGSATISNLAAGQCVQTGTGGLLTVTGSACGSGVASGSSFSLAVATGSQNFSGPISSSSVQSVIIFDSNTIIGQPLAGGTSTFWKLNSGSVTLQGVVTAASLGALTGNQTITLSGDVSGSGATSIAVTHAATQSNITTFTSSITVTNTAGIKVKEVDMSSFTAIAGNLTATSMTVTGASGLTVSNLSVSLPVQTDGNKTLTSAAIDLSGTQATGTMAAARMPALTGDITTSAGAVATTAAANQANIRTFTSSITVNNTLGLKVNTVVAMGSFTATAANLTTTSMTITGTGGLIVSTNAFIGGTTFYQNTGLSANSISDTGLASGQCVQTSAGGLFTVTGSACGSGGGYATVQDETTPLTQRTTINFTGAGVSCADNSGTSTTDCTISGGAGGGGYVAPATFTWVNQFGIQVSTIVAISSAAANVLTVSSSATGQFFFAVSSTPATAPSDYVMLVSSINGAGIFGVQNNGHLVSSGTTPTITMKGGTGIKTDSASTDVAGRVTHGGAATFVYLTFNNAWATTPFCILASTNAAYSPSSYTTAGATFTISGVTGSTFTWTCMGGKGG